MLKRSTKLLSVLSLTTLLGACQTVNPNVPLPTPGPIISILPADMQSYITQGCGIAVSTGMAEQLINLWTGTSHAEDIGNFIRSLCSSLVKSQGLRSARAIAPGTPVRTRFRGVTVVGRKVG